jgi:hypothetical protein
MFWGESAGFFTLNSIRRVLVTGWSRAAPALISEKTCSFLCFFGAVADGRSGNNLSKLIPAA